MPAGPARARAEGSEASYEAALEGAVEQALGALDLPTKVRLLTGADFWKLHPVPEAGLRAVVVSDGPQGVKGGSADHAETTASLPSPTALGASWDEGLAAEIGALLAGEARRKGVDVLLGPTINLHRSPLGGRHFEAFSEDPLLTGRIAVAYVRALQGAGVGGCPKHYVCNDSETERHTLRVEIAERPLHEVYLAPFERAVREARAWTTMAAYNGVNGFTMTESPLLRDPLKTGWGFDGAVMSDWYATKSTLPSARAALDLVMPGPDGPWGEKLLAAVRDGEVDEAAIDEKVRRLLRLAGRVGALAAVPAARPVAARRPVAEVATLVRRASAAGSVLLRNDGLLPLDAARLRRVAVLGPNAAAEPSQGGGSANLRPDYTVSPLEGLRSALGPGVEILTNAWDRARPGLQTVGRGEVALPAAAGPDAGPGILVRVFAVPPGAADADGRVEHLGRELGPETFRQIRLDGRLDWHGEPHLAGPAIVEVSTRIVSSETGRHRIGFATRGHVAVWLDGRQAADGTELPAGTDHDSLWRDPPFYVAEVEMAAGEPVEFVARWHKWYDETAAFLTLALEKPVVLEAEGLARAEELAAAVDAVVVCVGTTKDDESEGFDRSSLALRPAQDELVRRVAAANPRTVAVVSAGAPVLMPWRDEVAAILLTWFPGQEAGNALADVLLGRVEPGGRLPTTWPARTEDVPVLDTKPVDGVLAYREGLHVGYRAWLKSGRVPAFPFGHGLGYTSWEYVALTPTTAYGGPAVRVRLRNTGRRPGREIVQLYLARPDSAVERPVRWLGGFAAVGAEPGAETEVTVPIDRWALRHWDERAHDWAVEPGRFEVAVGRSVEDLRLRTSILIES